MTEEKLSEWWDTVLREPIKDGSTMFYVDTKYLPEIKHRIEALETELEKTNQLSIKLALQKGGQVDKLRELESENQRLKDENAEWERWNIRCIATKNEWGKKLTEVESRLSEVEIVINDYEKKHPQFNINLISSLKHALKIHPFK